jgi:uncharacterized protein (TIGR02145 family)
LILKQIPLISKKSKEFVGQIFYKYFVFYEVWPVENLKKHNMKLKILLFLLLPLLGLAQTNSKVEMPMGKNTTSEKQALDLKRNALYNLEELKVRWKKAALENCPGVPCPSLSAPGPCSSIVATPTGPTSASVSFVPPTSDGGSAITGYIVTATSTPSAPAKRKTTAAIITVSGTSSPIVVTGLVFGVNYIFSVVATNAVGPSPTITTTTTVTPCVLNTASAASSSPTLAVNTVLTPNITHSTTLATGIGTATGLPSGVTASWSANVITISGTPTATGSFSYEIPLTGGCGSVKATGNITVSTTPPPCSAGTASSTPTLTVNTVLTNITHSTTSATGIGTASGLPAGVSAAWSGNVITISGTPSVTGTFNYTIPLTGTSCSSVNATGTITVTTACGSVSSVPDYDGNAYATVSIGTQCWTTSNLKVTKYNDGTAIPDETANTGGWGGLNTGARTDYTGATGIPLGQTYVSTYGYLYNWYAAKGIATAGSPTYKNICPIGWHVPTDTEWFTLTNYLGTTPPGNAMKSTGTTYWSSQSTGTNNSSGFSALPGGSRVNDGSFSNIRTNAFFWSDAEDSSSSNNGYSRRLATNNGDVTRFSSNKSTGASVRCLKD